MAAFATQYTSERLYSLSLSQAVTSLRTASVSLDLGISIIMYNDFANISDEDFWQGIPEA